MRALIFGCLLLLFSAVCHADNAGLFFENVRVFDGEKVFDSVDVLVADGRIAAIGKDLYTPAAVTKIDGAGKTLLPGLIDCHTHAHSHPQLNQAVLFGVTTELDMMSMPQLSASFRKQQSDGKANDRADLFSAGFAVTVDGGHGTQFGFKVPTIDDADKTNEFVKSRIAEGSDYIKIIHEDGSAYGMSLPTLSDEMVVQSIKAAKANKVKAVAHIGSQAGAKLCIENGVSGLVHLFLESRIEPALVETAKSKGVFVVPTMVVSTNLVGGSDVENFLKDKSISRLLTNANKANLKNTYPQRPGMKASAALMKQNVALLHKAGVPILVGTDSPNPGTAHGASLHHELAMLVKAGLSPTEALTGATAKAADCFGLKDRGRIAKGMRADLVLVEGDPTKEISKSRAIVGVWKYGHAVDRQPRMDLVKREIKKAAERVTASEAMVVSNFDDGTAAVSQGVGWSVSTDATMGGRSTAEMKVVEGGADGSESALNVAGDCKVSAQAYAGVMYMAGDAAMQATDLGAYEGVAFWVRAEKPVSLNLLMFTKSGGFQPAIKPLQVTAEWKKVSVKFSELNGSDGSDVVGIWFGSNLEGKFQFTLDNVELTTEE